MSKQYLVFSSVGKHNALKKWFDSEIPNFDLCIVLYDDKNAELETLAKYVFYRKGGKFQNLHHIFKMYPDIFEQYEAIMVMDDDIIINATEINKLFKIRQKYELDILQPSFNRMGKISHAITKTHPFTKLRFTNFVEVTCPLFEKNYLLEFLSQFDPRANGGGVDFWFCDKASKKINKIAIVDEISCTNPHDLSKGGQREIDKFQTRDKRNSTWKMVKEENNLFFLENDFKIFKNVYNINLIQIYSVIYQIVSSIISRINKKFYD